MNSRAQAWSIDLIIGVIIFLLIAGVFYAVLTKVQNEDTSDLKVASETVAQKITADESASILTNERIDRAKLQALAEKEYEQLKQELGINTEFCMFFEDENGNVINITDSQNRTYVGIGNGELIIAGSSCGVGN